MVIYFFLIILTGLAAFIINDKNFSRLCIFLLLLVSAFRHETVGLDTINYVTGGLSEWAKGIKNSQFLYSWLTYIKPSGSSHLLVHVFSVILFLGVYYASKRFQVKPIYSFFFLILFGYYTLSMNIARQYAAIGLLLVAYSFLIENNSKKNLFFVFIALAFGFHSSSLIALLAYPLSFIDFSKIKKSYLFILIVICFILLRYKLNDYYLNWTQSIILDDALSGYSYYFEQATDANLSLGGEIIVFLTLCLNTYVLLALTDDNSKIGKLIASLFFFAIMVDIFFSNLYGNIGRLRYSLDIINIIAYSRYFCYIKSKLRYVVLLFILIFFGYDFVYMITGSSQAYGTVPYKFMF